MLDSFQLNDPQRQAVTQTDGPVLVLAGAGTGKTRVLTTRLAHILTEGKARPWEILAVTFTNRAAREMRDRVAKLLGRPVEGWWVGTFHALGARILRSHAEVVGLKSNFTILDQDDQVRLIKQLLEAHNIDPKKWPPRALLEVIQRWKDRGLTPDKVTGAEGSDVAEGRIHGLYVEYQERLRLLNAADFGDLLLHCLTLFQKQPEVLEKYQKTFRYILVDEYQDTNVSQYLWLRLLAQDHGNICCVGDDDQSIYSWRGAEVGNILRFEEDFAGATVVRLECNYRSTPHILGAASGLISHNEGRLGKTLWTESNEGDKVTVRAVWDGEDEARTTGDDIEVLHTKGHDLNEMAILVRAGFQTREFEERLITLGIPYRVIGGARFYERQEIRDAIAFLRVIAQPEDDLALERIINVPKRGLGLASLQTMHILARAERIPLMVSARRLVETDELKPRARNSLGGLLDDFDRWSGLRASMPHTELADLVLHESGYITMWETSRAAEAPGRLENLKEFMRALEDFEDLAGFLEHISLVMENEQSTSDDKVNLMTLHGAKGLEFDTVFLAGWEEELFPHPRTMEDRGGTGLEEERRLAYVGLTRARKRAVVSYTANRRIHGRWRMAIPSRFVGEMPDEHVVRVAETGLYNGGGSFRRGFGSSGTSLARDDFAETTPEEERFAIGERIFHQKFGYGKILLVEGSKLEIAFDKAGTKKVMDSFVKAL
jgi:DNA helicase II / ATP-dependent DNA helicase PcrA